MGPEGIGVYQILACCVVNRLCLDMARGREASTEIPGPLPPLP